MTSNNLNQSVITDHFADIGTMIEFGSGSLFVDVNKKLESGLVSLEKKAIKIPMGWRSDGRKASAGATVALP